MTLTFVLVAVNDEVSDALKQNFPVTKEGLSHQLFAMMNFLVILPVHIFYVR